MKEKVEKKVEQRIEQKVDQKVDESIDKSLEPSEKDNSMVSEKNASVSISAGGAIDKLNAELSGNTTVLRYADGIVIKTSWRTHDADIYDGIRVEIAGQNKLDRLKGKTFSKNKGLKRVSIGYDAKNQHALNQDSNKNTIRAVSDYYQNFDLVDGKITIKSINGNTVKFSINGKGQVGKTDGQKSLQNINGLVTADQPEIRDLTDRNYFSEDSSSSTRTERPSESAMDTYSGNTVSSGGGDIKPTYRFDGTIKATLYSEGQTVDYEQLISKSDPALFAMKVNMEGATVYSIIDNGNSVVLANTGGMKIKMSSSAAQSSFGAMIPTMDHESESVNLKKTGKTKSILGYTCEEVLFTHEDGKMTYWVTDELDATSFLGMSPDMSGGTVLEMQGISDGQTVTMKVKEINMNSTTTISTTEYKSFGQ